MPDAPTPTRTLGEALISLLEAHGVELVFGIPGVHTVELYRGLARSSIRHVTPRHEQGAGFMADGYARASGKAGVAFVITGPGLLNTLTAMGQARADSVPMLVISGVNARDTLGKGLGHLHEMPDQRGLTAKLALRSTRIESPADLPQALDEAFRIFSSERPGPVHIEIPTDVMALPVGDLRPVLDGAAKPTADPALIEQAAALLGGARRPLILAGGGAKAAERELRRLAEALDAPVVATTNARGLLHAHPLLVPAAPSLAPVRQLMAEADAVLAVGTEFGPTDYDMYGDNGFRVPENLVRIDIDAEQLGRHPGRIDIKADSAQALEALVAAVPRGGGREGAARARTTTQAARAALSPLLAGQLKAVEAIRDALPNSIIVGDSTQTIYAANLFYDHDRPGGWFNAATGFGALGFGAPAAVGAALGQPDVPVVCLTGDGGLQFVLAELGAALEAAAPVVFVVWNNRGYREIETSMRDAGVEPVGVSPVPPDFTLIAKAYGMTAERIEGAEGIGEAVKRARAVGRAALVEVMVA
ncbi:MAG: 5-guanidino-2-oxopentanoate decarboxylase [Methylobacterium mesophilicum]|nr:5-guanidino-2-oxopentanoate decarboxylase [Methylobacterium mesophilicum]